MSLPTVELTAILECKICLETYCNPKHLNCGHTYCQDCLDSILVFKEDGSAELPCPLRCPKKTILSNDETTTSLMTVYSFVDLLDKLSAKEKSKPLCQQDKECKKVISNSCTTCSAKICDNCQIKHSCANKSYTNVIFNQKLQELQPMCRQHNSLAIEVCIDCDNAFVCVYCTHRQHKNHEKKSISEVGMEAKERHQSFVTSFEETKLVLEKLAVEYNDALINLENGREIFVSELKARKYKQMEDYFKMLNAEEKTLLEYRDEKAQEFKTELISAGLIENEQKLQEFSDYVQVLNSQSAFELFGEKLEIERKLLSLPSLPRTVPSFKSHLHLMSPTNPLGEIKIRIDDVKTGGVDPTQFSLYENIIDKTEAHSNYSKLALDLMILVEDVKEYEKFLGNANLGSAEQLNCEGNRRRALQITKSYTYEELLQIIKNDDEKKFQSILIDHPNIVKMRGDKGLTLLIAAVWHNKPSMVKVLIDAGSDANAVTKNRSNSYHYSAKVGNKEVLEILLKNDKTNINDVNIFSLTPLHFASMNGHIECVKLLLSLPHIDVNIHCHTCNKTAYDVAANDTVKHLINKKKRK